MEQVQIILDREGTAQQKARNIILLGEDAIRALVLSVDPPEDVLQAIYILKHGTIYNPHDTTFLSCVQPLIY
jgi:hypothetical protein